MILSAVAPLFIPGDRPELLPKAAASGADAVIFDLEDAVAPDNKHTARKALSEPLPFDVVVRINDARSQWFEEDVAALDNEQVAAVILPKTESVQDLDLLKSSLSRAIPVVALVESVLGIENCNEIAEASARIAFGSLDFAHDICCAPEIEPLLYARSRLVIAARLAGKPAPIDGVTANFRDLSICESDTRHSVKMGFGGRLCIHPSQISIVQQGFCPSAEEIAWANTVLAAGPGVHNIDGIMVDGPVRLRASMILSRVRG